jgi:hypothetical protein
VTVKNSGLEPVIRFQFHVLLPFWTVELVVFKLVLLMASCRDEMFMQCKIMI